MIRMRIRLPLVNDPQHFHGGEIVEVEEAVAQRWVACGIAEVLPVPIETATIESRERAVLPRARKKSA